MRALVVLALLSGAHAFFLPAVPSVQVTNKVQKVKIDGLNVAIARTNGSCIAWIDACPHRGMSFEDALVSAGEVMCGYHGFKFDVSQNGTMTHGLGCKAGCSRLTMLPVRDQDGFMWVSTDGDESIEPVTMPPQHYCKGFRTITGSTRIDCTTEQFLENVVDAIHLPLVHTFGNRKDPTPHNYTATRTTPYTGTATFKYRTSETSVFALLDKNSTFLDVFNEYRLPATVGTTVTSQNGDVKVIRAHARQDGDQTIVYWSLTRNFVAHPLFDSLARFIFLATLSEDAVVLRKCDPMNQKGDFHNRYDALQVMRRHALRALSK
ncbi:Rieske [2Fe-2S] iron-sulfur domain-containing protein [Tribonema minus]|uniref:Rieske [2Fe-2S] iron-sulfur domain-containing protein n=1 Tax=Tribonema minus TaxID=303371 RepID=A0A835Z321_9STRA|nr:Rieske [2Fe-2S] iron-sulfur domain-containing protein [Tribonema minus]